MRIDIITIFPEYFAPLAVSLIGKAAQRGAISFGVHDLRTWTHDVHHSVDDAPFGGGVGEGGGGSRISHRERSFVFLCVSVPRWSIVLTAAP